MARVVHGTAATGFGGLEMVVEDFHEWLISKGHNVHVIVGEGTPLHKRFSSGKYGDTYSTIPRGWRGFLSALQIRRRYNTKDTAFLFHRQAGLKILFFIDPKAKISVLSHTFYGIPKTDFWHKILFSKVHQWIALTKAHRQNVIETCGVQPAKVEVIPNGVNLERFRIQNQNRPSADRKIRVGVVARLDQQKGQAIAIQAIAMLRQQGLDICLHLFGHDTPDNEPYRPVLENLIRENGLSEHVIFEGFQPEIEKRIPEMDVVWVPSHKETFGLCVIEAMACAVPVIASNAGGIPDIIRHEENGLCFQTKDPADLAAQTMRLIQAPGLYETIRQNALNEVRERYNREAVWTRLLETILPAQ